MCQFLTSFYTKKAKQYCGSLGLLTLADFEADNWIVGMLEVTEEKHCYYYGADAPAYKSIQFGQAL